MPREGKRVFRVLSFESPGDARERLLSLGVSPAEVGRFVAGIRSYLLRVPGEESATRDLEEACRRQGIACVSGRSERFLSVSSVAQLMELEKAGEAVARHLPELRDAIHRYERREFDLSARDRMLALGTIPRIMGILNVTPDSFSDGGMYIDPLRAVERGLEMHGAGADIIDVGGESTRPGSHPVPAEEELRRVIPVIRELSRRTDAVLSIDTTKAVVAREAVEAGARIVNDTSALADDPDMAEVVRSSCCAVVLMHRRGVPATMQDDPRYACFLDELIEELGDRLATAARAGIDPGRILVDPGVGFGKRIGDNLALHRRLSDLRNLGMPILFASSRKSFIGRITGRGEGDRLAGSLASSVAAAIRGAHVLRVHDVRETKEAMDVLAAIAKGAER